MKSDKDVKLNTERKIIPIGGGLLRLGETIPIDKFIVKESGKKNFFTTDGSVAIPVAKISSPEGIM